MLILAKRSKLADVNMHNSEISMTLKKVHSRCALPACVEPMIETKELGIRVMPPSKALVPSRAWAHIGR